MARFQMTEAQLLDMHRVLLDQLAESPALLLRAREMLDIMARGKSGPPPSVWDDWAAILDMDGPARAQRLLKNAPAEGLLRAHSPLVAALDTAERNRLWQVVGLGRFVGHVLDAMGGLGLDAGETEAVLRIPVATLEGWRAHPPAHVPEDGLARMKALVGIARALETLFQADVVRRGWLRTRCQDLAAVPLDLMAAEVPADGLARVHQHLSEAVGAHVDAAHMPRMG